MHKKAVLYELYQIESQDHQSAIMPRPFDLFRVLHMTCYNCGNDGNGIIPNYSSPAI